MDRESLSEEDRSRSVGTTTEATRWLRIRFSTRHLLIVVTGSCVGFAFIGFQSRRYASELSAVAILRSEYGATIIIPDWNGRADVNDAPIWSWRELIHGRLYVPNTYCSVGHYTNRPLEARFFTDLSKLHFIQTLKLSFQLRSRQFRLRFGRFPDMKELDVSGMEIYVDEINSLRAVRGLAILRMRNSCISNDYLACVGELSSINELDVSDNASIDDHGLAYLRHLVFLEKLFASGTNLHGECFASLTSCTSLKSLSMVDTKIDDTGVVALCKYLPNLKMLALGGPHLTDACMAVLAKHERLESLFIAAPMITDDGVRELLVAKRLYRVILRDTHTTDVSAGIVEDLAKRNGWRCDSF